MRVAYIAHPISGDVAGNIKKVKAIMQKIAREEPGVVPFAPYLTALEILDEDSPEQREQGISWNREFFRAEVIDELRVYGDIISSGVKEEITWAEEEDIPVYYMNELRLTREYTERGFSLGRFNDSYGEKCSLQKSSTAFVDHVWLGIDDPDPQIMASDAIRLGLPVPEGQNTGWVEYSIPSEVLIKTHMHLNQLQAKMVGEALLEFAKTGEV